MTRISSVQAFVAAGFFALGLACGVRATAAEAPGGKELTNSVGMKLVRIEPGQFIIGDGEDPPRDRKQWELRDWDESPAHTVTISKSYYLGACEVSNAQYERFDPAHKRFRGVHGASKTDDEPVTFVTWQQAVDFCRWLAEKEGRPYRLPSEAEWEYACRAGTTTAYSTGDALAPAQANFGLASDGQKRPATMPIGSYPANAWGLHDMHGNVAEWCLDWYGPYAAGAQTDPAGRADGYARITRGWSYLATSNPRGAARYCRSANRSGHLPEDANCCTGFRVAVGEMPGGKPLPAVVSPSQQDVKQTAAPAAGPDAAKPYFVNFAAEGTAPVIPKDTFGPIFSTWNHYSAACVCPNGDVLAAWYTTVQEEGRELAQGVSRLRAGAARWDPPSLFFDVPDLNDHAPVLFCDGKRIYHFCTQSLHGWDYASDIVRTSDDNGATWSKPRIMLSRDDPDHLSQPCSALLAKDGTLVLACDGDSHQRERLLLSRDRGATWSVAAGDLRATAGRYVIHPAIVQRADGALLSFMRGPNPMPVFVSTDLGGVWQEQATPFPGIGGGQKTAVLKLQSGAILLCSHDSKKQLVGGGTFAALSLDGGKTWPHVRKVEGPGGYMSLAQAPNGVIYLVGSRTSCAAFNEVWLRK